MATPNAQIALHLEASPTYQRLPQNLRVEWLVKVRSFPPAWLEKPTNGEQFESPAGCLERLIAYGFFEGSLFVSGKQRLDGTPSWEYWCKFHGLKTANKWRLEERVIQDLEGEVVTKRQRDTQNKRRDCPVAYVLSYKLVDRATKERRYIGHWKEDTHKNHDLHLNPFSFHRHEQSVDSHHRQLAEATRFRTGNLTYSEACHLLKSDSGGLMLSKKAYYNLVRYQRPDKTKEETIDGLLRALNDEGFVFRLRTKDEWVGEGQNQRCVSRKLIQIFWWAKSAVELTQRWAAGHTVVIDATFSTNSLRLPLIVAVGVTNENKTFPIAFSFCPSESTESFIFFFDCLRAIFFNGHVPEPAVILSDLAAGMISAFDTHHVMPYSKLQFCSWHVGEAIKVKFQRAGRYTMENIRGWKEIVAGVEVEHEGLLHYIWRWIQSPTKEALERNRTALLNALQAPEQQYILDYYRPKEERFVACYTHYSKNLGQNATQRVESYHRVLKDVTHSKFSLQESAKALCGKLNDIYTQLATAEDQAAINRLTALDMNFFRLLVASVSIFAIKETQKEWLAMIAKLRAGEQLEEDCHCVILSRYSLPCCHYLRPLYDAGTPIPRSFLHPRWWLKGPPIYERNWVPFISSEEQAKTPQPSSDQQDVHAALHNIANAWDHLEGDGQGRFGDQIFRMEQSLQISAREKETMASIPILNPDAIEKKRWRKTKNTQEARLLTASENADLEHKQAEKARKQAEKKAATLQAQTQQRAVEHRQQVSGFC